jgi:glutathione S-transferase
MGLQARGTGGVDSANVGGTWDVSNADRIGKGEVDLVNTLIEGAAQLVKWESLCDNGKQDEAFAEIDAKLSGEAPAAQEAAAYTMVYFGVRSRGEPPRLVAAYSGVTIENKALSPEEWGAFKADGAKPEEERTDNKAGIQSLPYVIHPDGKMQAETLDVMQIFATAGGKMVDDADTRAIGDKANSIANFIDPYLNLEQATRDAFGISTPQDEAFAQAAEAFKEFATTLGDKAFFAGDMPGYGEAFVFHNIDNAKSIEKDGSTKWAELVGDGWATLEKYHANFAGQPGVKEYLEARGDKCGMPGSIGQM